MDHNSAFDDRSALQRKRDLPQDAADDIDGEWPPRPTKMQRVLFPEAHGINSRIDWVAANAARGGAAGEGSGSTSVVAETSSTLVSSGNHDQIPDILMDRRPSLAPATGSPYWAQQAVRDARDPSFEFVNQHAIDPPMLPPDQKPRYGKPPNLSDEINLSSNRHADDDQPDNLSTFVLPFPTIYSDREYKAIVDKLHDKDDPYRLPGHRHHRRETPGSNLLDPSRTLHGVGRLRDPTFKLRLTKSKESLFLQQYLTQEGHTWSEGDVRAMGMWETLAEPVWMGKAYKGMETGDISQDEDFKDFVRGAILREREGEKPDMEDFAAVKAYLMKESLKK